MSSGDKNSTNAPSLWRGNLAHDARRNTRCAASVTDLVKKTENRRRHANLSMLYRSSFLWTHMGQGTRRGKIQPVLTTFRRPQNLFEVSTRLINSDKTAMPPAFYPPPAEGLPSESQSRMNQPLNTSNAPKKRRTRIRPENQENLSPFPAESAKTRA